MSLSNKKKIRLVKDMFLTHRQVGESEVYYKLFPSLHLSDSNIGVTFVPTGFKQNRSRFLKQITEEEAMFVPNVIQVDEKEGKFYVEKVTMMEKYLKRDDCVEKLTYSQFVKRYTSTKNVPKKYSGEAKHYKKESKYALEDIEIENEDYIFSDTIPSIGTIGIKLPKYFPVHIEPDVQWMQLRKPLVLRLHKFNKN